MLQTPARGRRLGFVCLELPVELPTLDAPPNMRPLEFGVICGVFWYEPLWEGRILLTALSIEHFALIPSFPFRGDCVGKDFEPIMFR